MHERFWIEAFMPFTFLSKRICWSSILDPREIQRIFKNLPGWDINLWGWRETDFEFYMLFYTVFSTLLLRFDILFNLEENDIFLAFYIPIPDHLRFSDKKCFAMGQRLRLTHISNIIGRTDWGTVRTTKSHSLRFESVNEVHERCCTSMALYFCVRC